MPHSSIQTYKSPIGELLLGSHEGQLCLADMRYRRMRTTIDKRIQQGLGAKYIEQSSSIIKETISQFESYFAGTRREFDIPLRMVGTEFQKSVWEALIQVPYGTTSTYLALARSLGNEKSVRAVASDNGANAIAILIPCHRIIGSNGELVGYAGGLPTKKKLLKLENNLFSLV